MRRTTLATLAVTSLLLAGLGGCGDDDPKPKFAKSDPPSPTATATSSPTSTTPEEPELPAAATKHTVAGAKAFTRYFMAVANYSVETLDPDDLKSISSSYCDGCNDAIASVQRLAKKKAHSVGGVWTERKISATPGKAGGKTLMQVTALGNSTKQTITYPNHDREIYRGGPTKDRFVLLPTPGGWTVDTWEVLP